MYRYYNHIVTCPLTGNRETVPVLCSVDFQKREPLRSAGCDNFHGDPECLRCIDRAFKAAYLPSDL